MRSNLATFLSPIVLLTFGQLHASDHTSISNRLSRSTQPYPGAYSHNSLSDSSQLKFPLLLQDSFNGDWKPGSDVLRKLPGNRSCARCAPTQLDQHSRASWNMRTPSFRAWDERSGLEFNAKRGPEPFANTCERAPGPLDSLGRFQFSRGGLMNSRLLVEPSNRVLRTRIRLREVRRLLLSRTNVRAVL